MAQREYWVRFVGPAENTGEYKFDGDEAEALEGFTKMLVESVGYGMFKILEFIPKEEFERRQQAEVAEVVEDVEDAEGDRGPEDPDDDTVH